MKIPLCLLSFFILATNSSLAMDKVKSSSFTFDIKYRSYFYSFSLDKKLIRLESIGHRTEYRVRKCSKKLFKQVQNQILRKMRTHEKRFTLRERQRRGHKYKINGKDHWVLTDSHYFNYLLNLATFVEPRIVIMRRRCKSYLASF